MSFSNKIKIGAFILIGILVLYFFIVLVLSANDPTLYKTIKKRCFQVFNISGLKNKEYDCVVFADMINLSDFNLSNKSLTYEAIFNRTEEYIRQDQSLDKLKNVSK